MTTIKHKSSIIAGHVPSSLAVGELAINEADSLLLFRNAAGAVISKHLGNGFLLSGSVANAAALDIDIAPYSGLGFAALKLFVTKLRATVSSSDLQLRVSLDGVNWKSGSGDYRWTFETSDAYGSEDSSDSDVLLLPDISTSTTNMGFAEVTIYDPYVSTEHSFLAEGVSDHYWCRSGGAYNGASGALSALRFFMSSGNFYGDWALYGVG